MPRALLPFLLLSGIFSAFCLTAQPKQLSYTNKAYEPGIRSVQLIPDGNGIADRFAPSVMDMASRASLVLEFDDLAEDADYYFIRFVHCNADWKP